MGRVRVKGMCVCVCVCVGGGGGGGGGVMVKESKHEVHCARFSVSQMDCRSPNWAGLIENYNAVTIMSVHLTTHQICQKAAISSKECVYVMTGHSEICP